MREPCSVDIWSYKVVQNPQKPELKRTSLTFFVYYNINGESRKSDKE